MLRCMTFHEELLWKLIEFEAIWIAASSTEINLTLYISTYIAAYPLYYTLN